MKTCGHCNQEKNDSDFNKGKTWCKICSREYEKQRMAKPENKAKKCANSKAKYEEKKQNIQVEIDPNETKVCSQCPDKGPQPLKNFHFNRQRGCLRAECRDCASKNRKKYYGDHKEETIKKTSQYTMNRMKKDAAFKLERIMRNRINYAFKSQSLKKNGHVVDYLDCKRDFFKKWIAYQMTEEMTEQNYGTVWHIDHVKPCSSFDLNKEEDIKECFNWKNCRPLLATENLEKSKKVDNKLIEEHKKLSAKFLKFCLDSGSEKVSA